MSLGMNEGQKARTRVYLDDFQKNNGGCLLCKKKITDFSFIPGNTPEGKIQLRIYGACTAHSQLSNVDELLEKKVEENLPKLVESQEFHKPILVEITFNDNGETLKYIK